MEKINTQKKSIRKCPHCHQDMEIQLGLSKGNLKKLFNKPTMDQWITLFIMLLAVSSFLIYRYEINAYNTYIEENCTCFNSNQNFNQLNNNFISNFTEFQDNGNTRNKEKS